MPPPIKIRPASLSVLILELPIQGTALQDAPVTVPEAPSPHAFVPAGIGITLTTCQVLLHLQTRRHALPITAQVRWSSVDGPPRFQLHTHSCLHVLRLWRRQSRFGRPVRAGMSALAPLSDLKPPASFIPSLTQRESYIQHSAGMENDLIYKHSPTTTPGSDSLLFGLSSRTSLSGLSTNILSGPR